MLSFYGNVKIEGPPEEVDFLHRLIQKAEAAQVRRSATVPYCEDFGRCNCVKGQCDKGLVT